MEIRLAVNEIQPTTNHIQHKTKEIQLTVNEIQLITSLNWKDIEEVVKLIVNCNK